MASTAAHTAAATVTAKAPVWPCRSASRPAAAEPTAYPMPVAPASSVIAAPTREAGAARSPSMKTLIMYGATTKPSTSTTTKSRGMLSVTSSGSDSTASPSAATRTLAA